MPGPLCFWAGRSAVMACRPVSVCPQGAVAVSGKAILRPGLREEPEGGSLKGTWSPGSLQDVRPAAKAPVPEAFERRGRGPGAADAPPGRKTVARQACLAHSACRANQRAKPAKPGTTAGQAAQLDALARRARTTGPAVSPWKDMKARQGLPFPNEPRVTAEQRRGSGRQAAWNRPWRTGDRHRLPATECPGPLAAVPGRCPGEAPAVPRDAKSRQGSQRPFPGQTRVLHRAGGFAGSWSAGRHCGKGPGEARPRGQPSSCSSAICFCSTNCKLQNYFNDFNTLRALLSGLKLT